MIRTSTVTASIAAAATVAAAALTFAPAASARPFPDQIALPTGSQPEGITSGPGTTFYAGSRRDGSIRTGDLRTGESRELVAGQAGRVAVGMQYDEATGRLWVAGGGSNAVTVYDARTGAELGRWVVPPTSGGARFLNDVAVTPDAVYVTDSLAAELLVLPTPHRSLPGPDGVRLLPLTGDWVQAATGNTANGIRVLPGGDLIVTASSTGDLFRVDPVTGAADRIETTGEDLNSGDGLVLRGSTLYVVNGVNNSNTVSVVKLGPGARTAEVVGRIGDDTLDRPTTGTIVAGALYLVNGRFSVANDPATTFSVSRVALH